jgi:hypothetical protein
MVVYVVDLCCLPCGRTIGSFETRRWPWFGPVVLNPPGGQPAISIATWSQLRCQTCNGNVYVDEVRPTKLYPSLALDDLDLPRRGRPPKWLVEQRQAGRSTDD